MSKLPAVRETSHGCYLICILTISLLLSVVSFWLVTSAPHVGLHWLHALSPVFPRLDVVDGYGAAAVASSTTATFVDASPGEMHLALVFDGNRLYWPAQLIRSVAYHTSLAVSFHLIMSSDMYDRIGQQLWNDSMHSSLVDNVRLHFYDIALCEQYTRLVAPFVHPMCPAAVMCKPFVPAILPQTLDRVLLVDSDATAVQDVAQCYQHAMTPEQQVAMAVDMGEICQQYPDRCWPMGFTITTQPGLRCGTPWTARMDAQPSDARCPTAGDLELFQFNGGVMLLNLANMRRLSWVNRFVQVAATTARHVGFQEARWCEQDLTNNFFRVHPSAVSELPCGCNYQFGGRRRDLHCPQQPIYFAHAWHANVKRRTANPYNSLFYYWLSDYALNRTVGPPLVSNVTGIAVQNLSTPLPVHVSCPVLRRPVPVSHAGTCPLQPLYGNCTFPGQDVSAGSVQYGQVVNVLTLLQGNAPAFRDMRRGLRAQSYPYLRHIVRTAGQEELAYAEGDVVVAAVRHTASGARAAGHQQECSGAATSDDDDDALRELHPHVADGWVLYLSEEHLLQQSSTIAALLAHATSTRSLVVWNILSAPPTLHKPSDRLGSDRDANKQGSRSSLSQPLVIGSFMFHHSQLANLTALQSRSPCMALTQHWDILAADLVHEHVEDVSVTLHPFSTASRTRLSTSSDQHSSNHSNNNETHRTRAAGVTRHGSPP